MQVIPRRFSMVFLKVPICLEKRKNNTSFLPFFTKRFSLTQHFSLMGLLLLPSFFVAVFAISSSHSQAIASAFAACETPGFSTSVCCTSDLLNVHASCTPPLAKRFVHQKRLVNPTWDTYPFPSGTVAPWGQPDTRIYGQVFVAPVGSSVLQAFQFRLRMPVGASVSYRAFVANWNSVLGAPTSYIFQGPTASFTSTGTDDVVVNAGAPIVSGQSYVMFLWADDFGTTGAWDFQFPDDANNPSGGQFVFLNNNLPPSNAAVVLNTPWTSFGGYIAFQVQFGLSGTE